VPQGGEMAAYFKAKADGTTPQYANLAPLDAGGRLAS
jgi:hypothetical protein